ncbi:MAG: Ig-like domain-containing protein, partial [Bacteroidota bacterium]
MKRFIHILSVFCLFSLFFQTAQGQTVNRKLYLKSGNLMDRTVGSTPIISSAFSKTGVSLVNDAVSVASNNGGSSNSLTLSYPTASYSSTRLMVVSIGSYVATNSTPRIDSVKYGSQKLIFLDSIVNSVNKVKIELWYLINPLSGSPKNVVSHWNGSLECAMGVASFTNIDIDYPIRSIKKQNSSATENSFHIESGLGDYIFDAIATNDNSFSSGGNQFMSQGTNSVDIRGSTINGTADSTLVRYQSLNDASSLIAVVLSGNSTNETFKLKPALCNPAVIKAGKQIEIKTFVNNLTLTAGSTLNTTPPIRAVVTNKNNTELFSINKPTWNSVSKTFIWKKTLSSDITIPAGDSLHFTVISDTTNVSFTLSYGSSGSASYVYLPFADIAVHDSTRVFSATGASGFIKKVNSGTTVYVRDTVRMPLGTYSLNNYQLEIKQGGTASGTIISPTLLASSDCQRVYEYAWTPSSPGDYYIISRIGEGSDSTTYSLDTTIFSVCNPTLTPTLVNPTTGSANGRIDLLLSNSIGDYTYNWTVTGHSAGSSSGSGSGNSITGLHAGTYAVTVNSVNGCQVTASGLVLSAFTAPALTITGKITNNCSGGSGNQGAVEVVVTSANAGPYTYAWSNGATTRTISGLANGTYNVVVTDNYSQSSPSTPFTVATSSAINITESTTDETCSLNDGRIDISVTGGSGSSYSYKWSNGYSIEDIDRISAGAYTVTITDAAGCTNVLSKTVALTCNRKPLANDDSFSALKGASTLTGNLATNDSDPDGHTLTYEKIDEPVGSTQGAISITSAGGITFTPVPAFVGLLKLRYKITESGAGSASLTDTAIVSLSIYNAGTDTICVSAGTARFAIDADPMYTTYAWT